METIAQEMVRRVRARTGRWKKSAARTRVYAARLAARCDLHRPSLPFDLVHAVRGGGHPLYVSFRSHVRIDLGGIHYRPHPVRLPHRRAWLERVVQIRHVLAHRTTATTRGLTSVRQGLSARPPWRPVAPPGEPASAGRAGGLTGLRALLRERWQVDRWLLGRPVEPPTPRPVPPVWLVAGDAGPRPGRPVAAPFVAASSRATLARIPTPPQPPTVRELTVRSTRVEAVGIRAGATRAAATPPAREIPRLLPALSSRLPTQVVRRTASGTPPAAATTALAFPAQPRPLAGAALRIPAHPPPSTERIEKTLREAMTVTVERTVRRELQRTLRPDTLLSRRLRERIQSELYDDLVLECERLGGR